MIGEDLKQVLDEIKKQRIKLYHILSFPLDTARNNEEIGITASYIYVMALDGTASIRLNELGEDSIDLFKNRQIIAPFYRLCLTNTAQVGKTLQLAIGVKSEWFSVEDYTAPDLALMAGYTEELRNNFSYNYGTQIAKSNTANNATVIIHTVTAGKTFLLEFFDLDVIGGSLTGTGIGTLTITDAADVSQYDLSTIHLLTSNSSSHNNSELRLSIPAGYKIKIISNQANLNAYGFIKGREV